jgi:arabinose-5-phosphate isomerase
MTVTPPPPTPSQHIPPPTAADPKPAAGSTPAQERALAERVIRAESRAVAGLADRLDDNFHRAVGIIVGCADAGGTVLVAGLGKSGLIGAKIAASLTSLGIPAHFLHPTEAAHGDLGSFRPQDVCLALSYSGETEEVVSLAALLRQDGIPIITITRGGAGGGSDGKASSLERLATAPLGIGPVEDESLSPAPACSTTATLALGDALALCASRRRNFTVDDFAKRHPGGSLGGKLRPVVESLRFVVGKNIVPVPDDTTVAGALAVADGAGARRPGAILLVDPKTGVLTGLFTDGDLRRLIERDRDGLDKPIAGVMTRSPRTLPSTALIRDAVQLVQASRTDEIPVVDEHGRPVGVLDVQDLIAMKLVQE